MKPYGLKRNLLLNYPDLADCLRRGAPSQKMKMRSKTRRAARRIHAKRERASSRSKLMIESGEY